jgi:hypothetical protein
MPAILSVRLSQRVPAEGRHRDPEQDLSYRLSRGVSWPRNEHSILLFDRRQTRRHYRLPLGGELLRAFRRGRRSHRYRVHFGHRCRFRLLHYRGWL